MTSVELASDRVGVGADPRPGLASLLGIAPSAVRVPGVPHVATGAAALLCAMAVSSAREVGAAWLGALLVLATIGIDRAGTAAGERGPSLRLVKRLLVLTAAVLTLASGTGWLDPSGVRGAGAVVLVAGCVMSAAVAADAAGRRPRRVLVAGGRAGVGQLVSQWSSALDVEVVGVCLPEIMDGAGQQIGAVPVVGSLGDVAAAARDLGVAEVVLVPGPLLSGYQVRRLSWALEGSAISLAVAADIDGVTPRRISTHVVGRRLTFRVRPAGRSRPEAWLKNVLDRAGAVVLLVLLSPLLALVAIMIRLDSQGPALFTQTRVGRDGRPFTIFKFRTMQADAEACLADLRCLDQGAGPLFKLARDPRTTGLGRLLRSCSIDELPQLINVVRGEMSLIGPRPGLPVETRMYDEWIHRRLRVKPGMTGAWQVGGRSHLSWTESVRLDIDYVDNSTLADDLRIMVKTAGAVATRDGAV